MDYEIQEVLETVQTDKQEEILELQETIEEMQEVMEYDGECVCDAFEAVQPDTTHSPQQLSCPCPDCVGE